MWADHWAKASGRNGLSADVAAAEGDGGDEYRYGLMAGGYPLDDTVAGRDCGTLSVH
jgi:hypothetical protein